MTENKMITTTKRILVGKIRFHVELASSKKAFILTAYEKQSGKNLSNNKYYTSFVEFSNFIESVFSKTQVNTIQLSVDNVELVPSIIDDEGEEHECWDGSVNLVFRCTDYAFVVNYTGLGLPNNTSVPVVEHTNDKYVEILMQMLQHNKLVWDLGDFLYKDEYKNH